LDEEEENEGESKPFVITKVKKDPTVDTSFLPDKERDEMEKRERDRLRLEWIEKQEQKKEQMIVVHYTFFDGMDRVRNLSVKFGSTIESFIESVKDQSNELNTVNMNQILFVKDSLIIPHDSTFYELSETKNIEWDIETTPYKKDRNQNQPVEIVDLKFYEKNSHFVPFSNWKEYDPQEEIKENEDGTSLSKKFWAGLYTNLEE